jgi:AraC-like DNA-binding protein
MAETYPTHPSHYTIYRLPPDIIAGQARQPLLADLMVTRAGYFPRARGHQTRRDSIDEYILIYCLEGEGWLQSGEQQWSIGPGQVAGVLPGLAHAYGADEAQPWTIQWVHFRGRHAGPLLALAGIGPAQPVVAVGERFRLVDAFNDLLRSLQSGYSLHYLVSAAANLRQILSSVALLAAYGPGSGPRDLHVQQTIRYMLNHVTEQKSLADFAAQAHLSPSHFSRSFREKTGYSPIDYFIRLKIQKACELLESSNQPVNQIGAYLGYSDPYYFSRLFKKIIGRSPRAYRTSETGDNRA